MIDEDIPTRSRDEIVSAEGDMPEWQILADLARDEDWGDQGH